MAFARSYPASAALLINVIKTESLFRNLPIIQSIYNKQFVRHRVNNKHTNPKFRLHRKLKVQKVKLPQVDEVDPDTLSKDEIRSKMKEMGMLPMRPWSEKPLFISCTGGIFEAYVPPEGDGKMSIISKIGAKQKVERIEKKSKSMLGVRKIRSYDEDFEPKLFAQEAQQIYIDAHNALVDNNFDALEKYVTEKAHLEMIENIKRKTIRWKFLGSIEPPAMVHCRCTNVITDTNMFAQATIRFHTQQMLAIYDRFGRLMYGSEILAKDVLEYVVFEKHLANQYGVWRLHSKIIPDWMPLPEPSPRTYIVETEQGLNQTEGDTSTSEVVETSPPVDSSSPTGSSPQLAAV